MGLRIGPSRSSLRKKQRRAEQHELQRLKRQEKKAEEEAIFASTEGLGIAESALIDLSLDEDDEFLSSGIVDDEEELGLFI